MLFNFSPGCVQNLFLERMLTNVRNFMQSTVGDRYLLGGWTDKDERFEWFLFVAEDGVS